MHLNVPKILSCGLFNLELTYDFERISQPHYCLKGNKKRRLVIHESETIELRNS